MRLGAVNFHLLIMLIRCYLEISEFWEGVHNDPKYDIETDGGHEDEEWYVVNYNQSELVERSLRSVCIDVLYKRRTKQIIKSFNELHIHKYVDT